MNGLKTFLCLALCVLLMAPACTLAAAEAETSVLEPDGMQALLDGYISTHGQNPDHISVGYVYTDTGETWFYNADRWYYSASMYKVPLMMLFAEQEARGEIDRDTQMLGTTFGYLEDSILIRSNNDWAHAMMAVMARSEPDCRDLYKQYADLPDDYYISDFRDYSYFTARFMTQVMTTLFSEPERFPHVIDCLLQAQPGEYFRSRVSEYEIAQKYGSLQERNGTNNNHVTAIFYTPHPFILTVMTENDPLPFTTLGELARLFTDYTTEEIDPRFEAALAAAEAAPSVAEQTEALPEPELTPQEGYAASPAGTPASAGTELPAAPTPDAAPTQTPAAPSAPERQGPSLRLFVLGGAAVLLLAFTLIRRLTRAADRQGRDRR